MKILAITLKDLQQVLRDKRSLLFLIAMPVAFTLFMGFAYRSGSTPDTGDNRPILVWDCAEPSAAAGSLRALLESDNSIKVVERQDAAQSTPAGTLTVPAAFHLNSSQANKSLTLSVDETTSAGQVLAAAVRNALLRLASAEEIAALSGSAGGDSAQAYSAALDRWQSAGEWVSFEAGSAPAAWYGSSPYNQASPGILVQFTLFGLVTSGQILMQERKTRTLQRMLSGPLSVWQVAAGHSLALLALVFAQEMLLVLFGQLALGVDYARQAAAVLLISLTLGLWIAALGLLIGALARSDSQVVLFSMIAMFFFAAFGGCWFPLEISSGLFATIGGLLPSAWAMTGFQNMLIRGLSFSAALQPALILSAYAAATFALAGWVFKKAGE